jgi:hypothetical protein
MAVTITNVLAGTTKKVADVEATADADTTATIPHGLGAAPAEVSITPLKAEFYTSVWRVSTIDATNVVVTKGTAMGSGVAGNQMRVIASLPHSLTK